MKRFSPLVLLVLAASVGQARAATIQVNAPSSANGLFDVFVNATNVFSAPHSGDTLLAYGFNISYNPSILSYRGETAGALFSDISKNPGFGAQVGGIGFLSPGSFTEPLNLAVLHFGVVGAGPTAIGINGDPILSLDQGLVYLNGLESISSSASLTAAVAVPEPAALVLAGAGLILLVFFHGRRAIRQPKLQAVKQ